MKECSPVSIDINRSAPAVDRITREGQVHIQQLTGALNAIALTRAMQEGYLMCCRDNGLPEPDMRDPAEQLGIGGVR